MTTSLVLTDPQEIENFKSFCQYRQELLQESANWKQVKEFAKKMQFGSFTLTIKDGIPVRIDKALQMVVLTQINPRI